MRHIRTLSIFLTFILVSSTPIVQAAAEQRTALVIGNSNYSSGPLTNPINDATDMAAALRKAGFTVVLKKDANLETMEEAIEDFGNRLKRGGVGLFYYAGHGVQVNGINYLIPIGERINKESDVRFKAFDVGRILAEMENANNGLNIVLLDACRDNPFGKSFRSASRGLAIVSNAPTGTFISYSTGAGQVANDGEGRNSPYTSALIQYMNKPGVTIEDVFKGVRQKLRKETGQVPWELSSLEGKFYFNAQGAPAQNTETAVAGTADVDDENRKLEEERQKLVREKELLEKRRKLEADRRKIEQEKANLEAETYAQRRAIEERELAKKSDVLVAKRPDSTTTVHNLGKVSETKRDGRFIAYDNGTVLDTQTNLMWAAKDNGANISWQGAKSYCENYRGAGYIDWRMPTLDELAGLFDASKGYRTSCGLDVHLTELIQLSCNFHWASERLGSDAANFNFWNGTSKWFSQYGVDAYLRVRPVRSAK